MKIIKSKIPIPRSKNKSKPRRLSNEEFEICRFVRKNPGVDPKFVSIRLGMPLDKATSILFGLEATNKLDRRFPDENKTKNKGGMTGIVKFYPPQVHLDAKLTLQLELRTTQKRTEHLHKMTIWS